MVIIDIKNSQINNRIYNGNTRKFGITIDNKDYIVKFSKNNDMSVYSEYIASNLIEKIGIPCHKVMLGKYKGALVNVIEDFTSGTNMSLHSFKDTKQSSEDTELNVKEYTYDDILYLIDKHLKMTYTNKMEAKKQFWNMFICDAIIGNRDRHWGNWGYLKPLDDSYNYKIAPLYDNGAGLFPGINKSIGQYINIETRKQFLYDRVFVFPASLFKIRKSDKAYRSNYAEMFSDLRINKIFAQQVKEIRRKIGYKRLYYLMHTICSDLPLDYCYKRFYIEIVTLRYMCIVLRLDFDKSYKELEEALRIHD